jgi:hypothetical protein
MQSNPFDKVKITRPPVKVIPAFSASEVEQLLHAINTKTAAGYCNYAIFLTMLDTGLRVSELCSLKVEKLWLQDGMAKVLGKGNKERMVPIGKQLQRILWHYIDRCRPEPTTPNCTSVFLTQAGRPLTRGRVQKMMTGYGQEAKLAGIRCSPHTLRHTAAIFFLRNGGDVFSLQRMLGHASLEMTRRYCELADIDVKRAHSMASPVDNLDFASGGVSIAFIVRRRFRPLKETTPAAAADLRQNEIQEDTLRGWRVARQGYKHERQAAVVGKDVMATGISRLQLFLLAQACTPVGTLPEIQEGSSMDALLV